MGNHSTKLVEKPKNYEEHEYQGGLHIFNIEGNVEGMYMVAYFGIVFLFVMVSASAASCAASPEELVA
jgi:hypothetical protein